MTPVKRIPMKSILSSFIAVSTALVISLSSSAFAQDEDAAAAQAEKKWDALGAQTEKIVQQELMKKYEGKRLFG